MPHLIFRLNQLPDLDIQTYTNRYGGDVRSRVFERQNDFLTLIHELGMYGSSDGGNGSTISLRFLYEPGRNRQAPQSIYLLFKNATGMADARLQATLLKSPLAEFYADWVPVVEEDELNRVLGLESYGCCVELIKEEATPDAMFKVQERQLMAQAEAGVGGFSVAQVEDMFRDLQGKNPFYFVPLYVPHRFEPVADNDMLFLDRYFQAFDAPLMLEITLRPTRPSREEIRSVESMLNYLDQVKSFSIKTEDERKSFSLRDDKQDFTAESISDAYEEYHESLLNDRQFEFAIKVWAEDADLARVLIDQVAVSCNASGKYRKLELKEGDADFEVSRQASRELGLAADVLWRDYWDDSWNREFKSDHHYDFNRSQLPPHSKKALFPVLWNLRRFSRLTEIDNIAAFFRLPVPGTEPLLTLRKETESLVADDGLDKHLISVGQDAFKPSITHLLEPEHLKKHMFVSGVPGSGKTTAILNVLVQLHEQGIPFLVFEPAKTEYRVLKRLKGQTYDPVCRADGPLKDQKLGESLQVYTLGQEHVSPFRFNPFEFPQGITLNEHVSSLESCFRGALPISTGPLPALINEAVDSVYARKGWIGTTVNDGSLEYPSLQELYDEIQTVFESKDYSGDVKGDLKTAIEVRIGSLLRRSIGCIFDADASLPNITTLMQTPCVIELDALNEEQSNLMIMFLLAQIREFVRANRRSGAALSHVIVLEEAHNIIGKAEEGSDEGGNPKAEATKYITQFLAEVRALGEGIIIADQLPSAVAPEVIKNTNIKLAHRMVSGDDREELGMTMLLDPNQYEDMARLPVGQLFLYREGMYKPVKVQGDYIAAKDRCEVLAKAPPDVRELLALIESDSWHESGKLNQLRRMARNLACAFNDELKCAKTNAIKLRAGLLESGDIASVDRAIIKVTELIDVLQIDFAEMVESWNRQRQALPASSAVDQAFTESKEAAELQNLTERFDAVVGGVVATRNELIAVGKNLTDGGNMEGTV